MRLLSTLPVCIALFALGCPAPAVSPEPAAPDSGSTSAAPEPTPSGAASAAPAATTEPSAAPVTSAGAAAAPAASGSRKFKGKSALVQHDNDGTYYVTVYEVDVKCGDAPKSPHLSSSGAWPSAKTIEKRPNLVTYSTKETPQNNPETTKVTYGKAPSATAPTTFKYEGYKVEVQYDDPLVVWEVEAATVPVVLCPR